MKLPVVRLVVAFVGLAVAVYGYASLSGCWLGKPPWWERRDLSQQEMNAVAVEEDVFQRQSGPLGEPNDRDPLPLKARANALTSAEARPGRERIISVALVAVGSAAAVVGLASAWPRRAKVRTPDAA